ncbi:MAG: hypothetical protein H7122_17475 [Chitinophagaceae bacterium]|nr:hypothetical protein [Chitinophagaceae bacterium]
MKKTIKSLAFPCLLFSLIFSCRYVDAQTITGAWKGKIKNTRLELKLIRSGDSLTGTSYYYESKNNFRRYTVKGYFDPLSNEVIWWDEMLVTDNASGMFARNLAPDALLSTADFNCPGEDKMLLDGTASLRDNKEIEKGNVQLQKTETSLFTDEWDFVIENYTVGANDPYIIDSISNIAFLQPQAPEPKKSLASVPETTRPVMSKSVIAPERKEFESPRLTVEQKFIARKKTLATVIPVTGDSIELRFYDNAEIDGDSIALFMNNVLVFKNIRLTDQAYTIKLATSSLENDNELVMVAENLGSIPPNTSLMVAIVGDKRYEARLQSTENSSALIRFIKQGDPRQ